MRKNSKNNVQPEDSYNADYERLLEFIKSVEVSPESQDESEYVEALQIKDRADVSPPPDPVIDKYNPDGIHSIITVAEHPYFLGLNLTPWQKLTLKMCYQGTPGNIDLKISNEKTNTCKGCVWKFNRDLESAQIETYKDHNLYTDNFLPVENSPCLTCTRFGNNLRNEKYKMLNDMAISPDEEQIIDELTKRENIDEYITEEEMFERDLPVDLQQQIKGKLGKQFKEIILVFGRRSGKSLLTSLIALYEVYRLISMKHPQKRFSLLPFDVIHLVNVAKSETQARLAIFDKVRPLAQTSPYFSQYIGRENLLEIYFRTPFDIEENKRREKSGQELIPGTIHLMCGHSESTTLLGLTCFLIIIDEMAAMANNSEYSPDDKLYDLLKPSLVQFRNQGKLICISNPMGPYGKFYKLALSAEKSNNTFMVQLPTWLVNPRVSQSELDEEKTKDPTSFAMQFAAEFGASGSDPWIESDFIHDAFNVDKYRRRAERGDHGTQYYMHIDPAYSSDYYTLAIVHTEPTLSLGPDGKNLQKIVVDHLHYFSPVSRNQPINIEEVDSYIIKLAQRFRFAQISYDHYWGSQASVSQLKAYGLNVIMTTYNGTYKEMIYSELHNLFTSGRIEFYGMNTEIFKEQENRIISLNEVSLAKEQFLVLQRKYKSNRYKVEALAGNKDDMPDAVAGAAYQALKFRIQNKLPRTVTVNTGNRIR